MTKVFKAASIFLLIFTLYFFFTKPVRAAYDCNNISVSNVTESGGDITFSQLPTLPTADYTQFKTWAQCNGFFGIASFPLDQACLDPTQISLVRTVADWKGCWEREVTIYLYGRTEAWCLWFCNGTPCGEEVCTYTFTPQDVAPLPTPGDYFNPSICNISYCSGPGPCKNVEGLSTAFGCIPNHPLLFIGHFRDLIIGIGGGIAFLLMIVGAFFYLTSQGQPERVQRGKEVFFGALVGLVFMIFSIFLLKFITEDILNLF